MVGRLSNIIREGADPVHPKWPMIEISRLVSVKVIIRDRCYKKEDLDFAALGIASNEIGCIGENELFESDVSEKVYVDKMNGRCNVWKISEYDGKAGLGTTDYYTRAKYDPTTVY